VIQHQSDNLELTKANEGISATILEHIREYVNNLWTGSIFEKVMNYAFLLLLRLKLAPEREKKHKERVRAAAQRKAEAIKQKQARTSLSTGRWNRRLTDLCDDLSDILCMPEGEKRTRRWSVITACISKLLRCKPAATPKDLPGIEEQLQQLKEQDSDTATDESAEPCVPKDPEDEEERGVDDDLDNLGDDDETDEDVEDSEDSSLQ
ncbi:hypothetical protein BGZ68_004119, partial [Mortierella alpina]